MGSGVLYKVGVYIDSATPTGAAGLMIQNDLIAIADKLESHDTSLAAKLPLSGGTLSGDVNTGAVTIKVNNGTAPVGYGWIFQEDTTPTLDGFQLNTRGFDLTMGPNAGGGTGGGTLHMDGGSITGAATVTATSFVGALTGNATSITGSITQSQVTGLSAFLSSITSGLAGKTNLAPGVTNGIATLSGVGGLQNSGVTLGSLLFLTGGTLTGGLSGTTATFSGAGSFGSLTSGAATLSGTLQSSGGTWNIDTAGNAVFNGEVDVASTVITGTTYTKGSVKARNKANTAWLDLITRDTSGSEAVYDLANVGGVAASKRITAGVVNLGSSLSGTISTDASLGNQFSGTLTGNISLAVPTNPVDGQTITYVLKQDGTGGRTVTLTTGATGAFAFGSDVPNPTVGDVANKTSVIVALYNATAARWWVLTWVMGY